MARLLRQAARPSEATIAPMAAFECAGAKPSALRNSMERTLPSQRLDKPERVLAWAAARNSTVRGHPLESRIRGGWGEAGFIDLQGKKD